MGVTDPVATGLAESLARPGGNITGITNVAGVLAGKRLELLKEVLPKLTRVAVLWDPKAPGSMPQWEASKEPAEKLGLQLYSMQVSSVEDYAAAFKEAVKAHSHAVWVTLNPVANSNQKLIAELAVDSNLPSICARSDYAENGCLMAYGPGYQTEGSDGARYVDRILKGRQAGRPADRAADQVRAGDQPEDREPDRPDGAAVGARPRRQAGALKAYACSPLFSPVAGAPHDLERFPQDRGSRTPL